MAAAAPARVTRDSGKRKTIRRLTPEEAKNSIAELNVDYTKVYNGYFDVLPSKIPPGLEYIAIGQVIRRSHGGVDRSEWVALSAAELADITRSTIDGCEKALESALEHGFLEVRKLGRVNMYRVVLAAFELADPRKLREIRRKPARTSHEASEPVARAVVTLGPGLRSEAIQLTSSLQARYRNESRFPINVSAEEDDDGLLDISVFVEEGEGEANDTRTRVRQSDAGSVENTIPPYDLIEPQELRVMREFLVRWCARKIHRSPTDLEVSAIAGSLNGIERRHFAPVLKRLVERSDELTWEDVRSAAARLAVHKKATTIVRGRGKKRKAIATATVRPERAITGDTFAVKDALRGLGGRWSPDEKVWMLPEDKADEAQRIVDETAVARMSRKSRSLALTKKPKEIDLTQEQIDELNSHYGRKS